MATYTKGFKKKTTEHTLLMTIVAIIAAVLIIVGVVFIYDLATDSGSYEDFTIIDAYDKVLTQKDANQVQLQNYLVYFYSDSCPNCVEIKREALKLADKINGETTVIFFVNTSTVKETTTGDKEILLDEINEASLKTPMVISVVDGVFYRSYIGSGNVLDLLTDVEAGTYTPFN